MGSCVECRTPADCSADQPICDANACRTCALDTECASGACADNGTCVGETSIVYIDGANGFDAGTCTRSGPCKTLQFGIQNALPMRNHIVMAVGVYVENVSIDGATTTASAVTIHGGGATLEPEPGSDLATITSGSVATTIHDVTFAGNAAFGAALQSNSAPCTIGRAHFQDSGGVLVGTNMTIVDADFSNSTGTPITVGGTGGHLLVDRVSIHGGVRGVLSNASGAIVSITNLLVFGTSGLAVDLTGASGIVRFTTVSDAGSGGPGQRVFQCSSGLVVESSIVWTPGQNAIGGGCQFNTTIAGPIGVAGTTNADPAFLDPTHHDYHLAPTSPAKDLAATGPTTDLDGHPRPQGAGFDLGAFEAP